MWDWLNGDNLKAVGTIVGGVGSAYSAYEQGKTAKEILNLQKADYNRSIAKEDRTQSNIDNAFASVYEKQKKDEAMDLGV